MFPIARPIYNTSKIQKYFLNRIKTNFETKQKKIWLIEIYFLITNFLTLLNYQTFPNLTSKMYCRTDILLKPNAENGE